jgi:uncharacterized protein (DUF1330 family)
MHPVVLTDEDLASAEHKVLPNTPVVMLNLVAFNSSALYEDSSFLACSGREAYFQRYAPAFRQAAAAAGVEGIKVLYVGAVAATLVGPTDPRWDAMALVEYPDFEALRKVLQSPLYKAEAEPHRKAALKAWQFTMTTQPR